MQSTKLLYMEDMQQLECKAFVENIDQQNGRTIVYLDQTVFYPQGGGQPYDTGSIEAPGTRYMVEEVRFVEGQVQHIGHYEGRPFMQGEDVTCKVAEDRRVLHTRVHSGGHLLDMAVAELGYDWIPGKGYHFPDGPYVEYQGELNGEMVEDVIGKLDKKIAEIQSRNLHTTIQFVSLDEMRKLCRHVPDYLPKDKPSRVVLYGDFGVPCGGTHVQKLAEVGRETIRKIKVKNDVIRISYEISN